MLMSWLRSRSKGTNSLLCRHILKYKISYVYNYDSFLALNWQVKNSPYVLMFVFIIWIVYWEFMFLPNIVHVLIGSNLQGFGRWQASPQDCTHIHSQTVWAGPFVVGCCRKVCHSRLSCIGAKHIEVALDDLVGNNKPRTPTSPTLAYQTSCFFWGSLGSLQILVYTRMLYSFDLWHMDGCSHNRCQYLLLISNLIFVSDLYWIESSYIF